MTPPRGIFELFLIVLVFAIGTGSFLFHTLATRWAAIADVAPIGVFMLLYTGYALKRFAGLGWLLSGLGLAGFFYVMMQAGQMRCGPTLCLGGSIAYLPALAALLVIGLGLTLKRHPAGASLLAAGAVFALSLTLRTFDKAWCGETVVASYGAIGTHLWWHVLNALVLFILLRAALLFGAGRPRSSRNPNVAPAH